MRLFDLLTMSINNLRRRKLRTALTVLGVIIGTASIVVMVSLGIGLKEMTMEQYASSGSLTKITVSRNYSMSNTENAEDSYIVDDTIKLFSRLDHVRAVSPVLSVYVYMRQGIYSSSSSLTGLSREGLEEITLGKGRLPDSNAQTMELVIGNMVQRDFYNSKTGRGYWDTGEMPDVDLDQESFFTTFQSTGSEDNKQKKYIFPACGMVKGGPEEYNEYSWGIYTDVELLKTQLKRVY